MFEKNTISVSCGWPLIKIGLKALIVEFSVAPCPVLVFVSICLLSSSTWYSFDVWAWLWERYVIVKCAWKTGSQKYIGAGKVMFDVIRDIVNSLWRCLMKIMGK